ncbi:MAG: thioredoxin family protein, partial [Pseudomonadota bacterium]
SGAFFTGVLAALVGAPCIGPFLGVALGAVITQPAGIVFLVFSLVGFGLALPFLLLSFVPGLSGVLPKPGAWMERLKQFFAFPMFLTAVWLLSVVGEQVGLGAVIWTLAGAALIGFGAWMIGLGHGAWRWAGLVFGGLALLAGIGLPLRATLGDAVAEPGAAVSLASDTGVPWSPEKVRETLEQGRGVFVDFTATWCATCQLNKVTTLRKAAVQEAFENKNVVFMVADFTNRDPEIAEELKRRNRPGVPMYLYYPPGVQTPKILPQILSETLILSELNGNASLDTR